MDQVVKNMPILNEARNTVEIIVHVSEILEDRQRNNLVAAMEEDDGIVSAEFCYLRNHLILVRYDMDMYSSQDVLACVRSLNVNARLIGPV
jgi:hypothetical protein